ncbi:MAG: ATP-dependent Clp protease adaptor ClpS [Bacteroidales bacterium]|nr:ATP-dependent Clp protease adaptor ClpS [Bacteroidales bacterium]
MIFRIMHKEQLFPAEGTHELLSGSKELVLFNDDVNTFDFVIQALIDVCEHDPMQAEQCVLIAHFNGKCPVKTGTFEFLKPIYNELTNRSLTVTID